MKAIKSSALKSFAKKALTLGLAAILITSCGSDKKPANSTGVATANPYGFPTSSVQGCGSPIERVFNFNQGTLTPASYNGAAVLATYLGMDQTTGDSAILRDHGNGSYQLILRLCPTSDQNINSMLTYGVPQVSQNFNVDANVPNRATCPGRINSLTVLFGYTSGGWGNPQPVYSAFSPTQECM